MGAIAQNTKQQVVFEYLLTSQNGAEFPLIVIADVYPAQYATIRDRVPEDDGCDQYADILSVVYASEAQCKSECWDDLPKFMRRDIEAVAIQKANEKLA